MGGEGRDLVSSREDVNRIEDPKASPGEAAVAFRRLVTRRGLAVLEANRREADELLRLYTGKTERPTKEALGDLEHVMELDIALRRELARLTPSFAMAREAKAQGRKLSSAEDLHAYVHDKRERVVLARELLTDAFP